MGIVLILGAVVFLAACIPDPPPCSDGSCVLASQATHDELAELAQLVHDFYGTRAPTPAVVAFDRGNCDGFRRASSGETVAVTGGKILVDSPSGPFCALGNWRPSDNTVYMTLLDWQETLCHELLHQWLVDQFGDGDAQHTRPE